MAKTAAPTSNRNSSESLAESEAAEALSDAR